ncbi:MAG: glycosyltransferase family 87 protein [Pseudomonadota bacterium]
MHIPQTARAKPIQLLLSLIVLFFALLYFIAFGYFGLFRSGDFGFDFEVFHTAGQRMLSGQNPWLAAIGEAAFSYPPNISSVLLLFGALPFHIALALQSLASILAIGSLVLLANLTFLRIETLSDLTTKKSLCISALIASPFGAHIFFMGQFSLITTACALWAWHLSRGSSVIWAGVLLGVASIKPQICFLLVVWFLLEGKFKIVLIGGVVGVLMAVPAFVMLGVIGAISSWIQSMTYYLSVPFNQAGFQHVVGLDSLFVALGVANLGLVFRLAGIAAFILLFLRRHAFSEMTALFLIFSISLTFFYGHDYDYIMVVPMMSYLLLLAFNQSRWLSTAVGIGLIFLFWLPQRFLRDIDFDAILHWRTVVLILCSILLIWWERQQRQEGAQAVPAQ